MTLIVTKTCHFFVFVYWRETRKHSYWLKIFFGPMKMFSCPPSINKNIVLNKEVTNFCDKSRHLFLWQTNRTRLIDIILIAVTVLEMSIIGIFMKREPHWYVLVYPSLIHPARGILQTMAIFMVVAVATERYG